MTFVGAPGFAYTTSACAIGVTMVTSRVAATAKTPKLSFFRVFKVLVILLPYINQVK
jgi:hypothetical protein